MLKKLLLTVVLMAMGLLSLQATDLEATLQAMTDDAARSYVNPMVSSFGSDMNSGWFHQVPPPVRQAWNFEIGMVAMGTLFIEDDKFFDVNGKFSFTKAQAEELAADYQGEDFFDELVAQIMRQEFVLGLSGPTVIGPAYDEATGENPILINFDEQDITFVFNNVSMTRPIPAQEVVIPIGGLLDDYPAMPLVAPQLSIGTFYGTKLSLRYLPEVVTVREIGKISYLGFGIQHNPAVWFSEPLPFDIAVAYFTQNLSIGTAVEATASTYGINIAKTFGKRLIYVTPYLGLAAETSKMHFKYDYITDSSLDQFPEVIKIDFYADGKNKTKITTGLSFRLGLVNLNFDVNFAKYPSASAGVMLNFGW